MNSVMVRSLSHARCRRRTAGHQGSEGRGDEEAGVKVTGLQGWASCQDWVGVLIGCWFSTIMTDSINDCYAAATTRQSTSDRGCTARQAEKGRVKPVGL